MESSCLTDPNGMITMKAMDFYDLIDTVSKRSAQETVKAITASPFYVEDAIPCGTASPALCRDGKSDESRSQNLENQTAPSTDMLEGESDMSKRIRQRATIGGQEVWITGSTQQEIFDNLLKKAQEMGRLTPGAGNQMGGKEKSIPGFEEYLNEWWKLYKEPKLRQTTKTTYRNLIDCHIMPFFGRMRLDEIGANTVQEFYNAHLNLSKSSVRQMSIILHQVFDMAVEDGFMRNNPTESKRLTMTDKASRREALKDEEVRSILEHLPELKETERLTVAILMMTGMRRGEMLGIRWTDIDWTQKLIHVEKAVTFHNNQPVIGPTKSDAGERDILEPCRKEEGYIIGDGQKPLTERTFIRMWQRIGKTIDLYGATPHRMRHTYITLAASSGVDVKTLQEIAGHADIKMTMERYAHARREKVIQAGKVIGSVFAEM